MNPQKNPLSFSEVCLLVRRHGYVWVAFPSSAEPEIIAYGWGPSTRPACASACGNKLADLLCDSLNNGGRMTDWKSVKSDGENLMYCDVENEDGQSLVRFYR